MYICFSLCNIIYTSGYSRYQCCRLRSPGAGSACTPVTCTFPPGSEKQSGNLYICCGVPSSGKALRCRVPKDLPDNFWPRWYHFRRGKSWSFTRRPQPWRCFGCAGQWDLDEWTWAERWAGHMGQILSCIHQWSELRLSSEWVQVGLFRDQASLWSSGRAYQCFCFCQR